MKAAKNFVARLVFLTALAVGSTLAHAQVSLSIDVAPPPLQAYDQPPCPDDGYIWTPGYWAYGDSGYYWVPGSWVQPPQVGFLWTPPYWGWDGGSYVFSQGYWGPTVGFYGGIDYGYGYGGHGYGGGRWQGGHFFYNTAVNNVRAGSIHNTYVDRSVVRNSTARVSYNGGRGGVQAQPTAREREVSKGHIITASSHPKGATVHSAASTQGKPETHQTETHQAAVHQAATHEAETHQATEAHSAAVHEHHTQHTASRPEPQHQQSKPKQEAHAEKKGDKH